MRHTDLERLRRLVAESYTVAIERRYGASGMERLRDLTAALDTIHEELAYELLADGLTVFSTLDPHHRPLPAATTMPVTPSRLPTLVQGRATVQVLPDHSLLLSCEEQDPMQLASDAVVYHFDGRDRFVIDGEFHDVMNVTPFPSIWGTPTFFILEDALEFYRDSIALVCDCDILADELWHDRDRRWFLRNRPEDSMQHSLWRYLRQTMRGTNRVVEVDREQPVDGRRPPDIKITWAQSKRIALIEIKWIGKSVDRSGTRISRFEPDEADANRGAQQLVDYLDANFRRAVNHQSKGYLVVFDARRRNLRLESRDLSREDALYFLLRDIAWVPDHSTRHDFETPLRCFLRPLEPAA